MKKKSASTHPLDGGWHVAQDAPAALAEHNRAINLRSKLAHVVCLYQDFCSLSCRGDRVQRACQEAVFVPLRDGDGDSSFRDPGNVDARGHRWGRGGQITYVLQVGEAHAHCARSISASSLGV
jgi:hypothetical protein